MKLRIGATLGLGLGAYLMLKELWQYRASGAQAMAVVGVRNMTGYDYKKGTWDAANAGFLIPAAAGIGLSFVASKTGINRYTPKGINL